MTRTMAMTRRTEAMRTLDLREAAQFLRMSPTVRQDKARRVFVKVAKLASAGSSSTTILLSICASYTLVDGKRR